MLNRREFVSLLAAASAAFKTQASFASTSSPDIANVAVRSADEGFPLSDYTPFGYLDNPWHTWNMHQSGILRSLPGIGFGLYYPAGPGGYFDYHRNEVYVAELALGFRIGNRVFIDEEDFRQGQLISPHHSKNILQYHFEEDSVAIESSFFLVNEDALAAHVKITEQSGHAKSVGALALHTYQLGGSQWWGGDGVAGDFDQEEDVLWARSFAAGTVFAVTANIRSSRHFFSTHAADRKTWLSSSPKNGEKLSYSTQPLYGGLHFDLSLAPHAQKEFFVLMARAANLPAVIKQAHASLPQSSTVMREKFDEDISFWNGAPKLTGDWPKHWQHGWVYDFETLRTMVRWPIGAYKHPWDAMQIQAPRNVLAETSIDMWALSYANPAMAKKVFLGQFLDAIEDNIPCMREDGVMNMVAADGSECGTSISWCFPFFCAESIYNRTRDLAWLRQLYPKLSAFLRWTLKHRTDSGGFIVGKCSWETGMDTSKRFQIQQPTGGELVEFLRLVELQAAASQAGAILARFAELVSDQKNIPEWEHIQKNFAEKTQQLWQGDWFHDFDTRSMKLVNAPERDPSQAAPAFCGIATDSQQKLLLPTLRKMYEDMLAQAQIPESSADNALNWSSFVLPFLESAWSSGDGELAPKTVENICERIYASMDRRVLQAGSKIPRLGWPGTSCEIWGAHGAFGGEVYGWGAVMPAHMIRNLIGFRETGAVDQIILSPGFSSVLSGRDKQYGIARLPYAQQWISIQFTFEDDRNLHTEIELPQGTRVLSVTEIGGQPQKVEREGGRWQFKAVNYARYQVKLAGFSGLS
jgi:hypothetical protein